MQTKIPATPTKNIAGENACLNDAIRYCVSTYTLWHSRPQASQQFGVSRNV